MWEFELSETRDKLLTGVKNFMENNCEDTDTQTQQLARYNIYDRYSHPTTGPK